MNERVYQTMSRTGAGCLTLGIITLITGIITGVLMIVGGARLLHDKKDIMI